MVSAIEGHQQYSCNLLVACVFAAVSWTRFMFVRSYGSIVGYMTSTSRSGPAPLSRSSISIPCQIK